MNGRELFNISQAHLNRTLAGDGPYTQKCQNILSTKLGNRPVFITHSGTAALELALLSLNLCSTDEVIVPSFTFVSCANAVLIAGGQPVFADINPNTQNLSIASFKNTISKFTKAVIVVHYAGISSELTEIIQFARTQGIVVIEDAAHCLGSLLNGQELGTLGDFGCFSFHETKNITCGEGGALVVNRPMDVNKIEVIREKGTDRSIFLRGLTDKYTWRNKGSSYLPSEITTAFLCAQLDDIDLVTSNRRNSWLHYHELLSLGEREGLFERPSFSHNSVLNGHIYYILLRDGSIRDEVIASMRRLQIQLTFHYVPLHSSPYGIQFRSDKSSMSVTERNASRLMRLPLWFGLTEQEREIVANSLHLILKNAN